MNCSSGCKFCYEKYLKKIFPDIVIKDKGLRYCYRDEKINHIKYADFFDRGIDIRKVDLFKYTAKGFLYTTGLNFSISEAEYFSNLGVKPNLWLCYNIRR